MLRLDGVYHLTWSGAAKKNLVRQLPLIAESFPEIAGYYPATVNIRFAPLIVIAKADHRTLPLNWKAGGEDGETGEVFDLLRCRLTVGDRPPAAALIYVGHWSLHRLDPHKHEFLVERFIEGLTDGEPVVMDYSGEFIDLSYTKRKHADAARTVVLGCTH